MMRTEQRSVFVPFLSLLFVLAWALSCGPSAELESPRGGAPSEEAPSEKAPVIDSEIGVGTAESLALGDVAQGPIFKSASEALRAEPGSFDVYLFYLHGRIIENGDRRPTHPEYGVYEFDQVLRALAVPGVAVISEVREAQTDPATYAAKIVTQIGELFAAGIESSAITVIGFSKGGVIALATSHQLAHDGVGFVILAGCGSWLETMSLRPRGRMLSIHEASDSVGACRPWLESSLENLFFHEVEIAIGGSHGAFYRPHSDWLDQTLVWAGAPSIVSQMVPPERVEGGI